MDRYGFSSLKKLANRIQCGLSCITIKHPVQMCHINFSFPSLSSFIIPESSLPQLLLPPTLTFNPCTRHPHMALTPLPLASWARSPLPHKRPRTPWHRLVSLANQPLETQSLMPMPLIMLLWLLPATMEFQTNRP